MQSIIDFIDCLFTCTFWIIFGFKSIVFWKNFCETFIFKNPMEVIGYLLIAFIQIFEVKILMYFYFCSFLTRHAFNIF